MGRKGTGEHAPLRRSHREGVLALSVFVGVGGAIELSELSLNRERLGRIVAHDESEAVRVAEVLENMVDGLSDQLLLVWHVARHENRQRRRLDLLA